MAIQAYKMKRKLFLILVFLINYTFAFSQSGNDQQQAIFVVGKPLSSTDSNFIKELYFEGIHEKIVQNYQKAAETFSSIIEIDPSHHAALYELATIDHARGQEKNAERLIRNAVTVKPENEWYWLLLADIYKKANKMPDLVLVFDELIQLSPEKIDYHFDKAKALILQNKVDDALKVYKEIEKRFGVSDELTFATNAALNQGKPDKIKDQLEIQIQNNPHDLSSYLYLSESYSKEGSWKKALAVLEKAKIQSPDNSIIRLALADNYLAMRNLDDAFNELKIAFEDIDLNIDKKVKIVLTFFPLFTDAKARNYAVQLASIMADKHSDEAKAFAIYGDVLFQNQQYDKSLDAYKKALKLNAQVYQIWEQLVRIEVSQGNYAEAISDGEEALSIFPNQSELYLYIGIAYSQTKKHEKAITYLKNAAALQLEDNAALSQIYSSLGDSYNALKKYKESDSAYEKSLDLSPDNSYTLNNYAYYLSLRRENLVEAEKMSRKSNELEPNNSSYQDTYAWILFRLNRFQEAEDWILKALGNSKTHNGVQVEHYGDILYHLDKKQKAFEQWQKAKTLGAKSDTLNKKINEKRYIE